MWVVERIYEAVDVEHDDISAEADEWRDNGERAQREHIVDGPKRHAERKREEEDADKGEQLHVLA